VRHVRVQKIVGAYIGRRAVGCWMLDCFFARGASSFGLSRCVVIACVSWGGSVDFLEGESRRMT